MDPLFSEFGTQVPALHLVLGSQISILRHELDDFISTSSLDCLTFRQQMERMLKPPGTREPQLSLLVLFPQGILANDVPFVYKL